MTGNPVKSAVLWTGGKDSALALHQSLASGIAVTDLITFAPVRPDFIAHPLAVMRAQAQAMGIAHRVISIQEPYRENYIAALQSLRQDEGIGTLITGDIDLVGGLPNWVRECCQGLDIEVLTPLWGAAREMLMRSLLADGFQVIFSLVKSPWLDETWVGRTIDEGCIEQLNELGRRNGLDLCGENGEFHTLVLDGPLFSQCVHLETRQAQRRDNMMYLDIAKIELMPK
jgi:diphthine-ammonia ligase